MVVSGRRVLITGCSGFIGRSLAKACLADGWAVRGSIRAHHSQTDLPVGVEPVAVADIGPSTDWSEALNRVDVVVHLAARVHRDRDGSGGPGTGSAYFHTNAAGTARLARAAADAGVKRLVFLSTLKVNAEDRVEACRETDPEAPCGPYARSKYEAEIVLREISSQTGFQTVILRPPLVYGPGVKANFLSLLKIVDRGIPLPLASVCNRRSLIYVRNLVDVISICLTHPDAAGNTYLAADDETLSTPGLVREIAEALKVTTRLFPCPKAFLSAAARVAGMGEDFRRLTGSLWADTEKIRLGLDWQPKSSVREGLKATVAWYRAVRSS